MVQPGKELSLWLHSSPRDSHRVVVAVEIKWTRVGVNCDHSIVKLTCSKRKGRKQSHSYSGSKDKAVHTEISYIHLNGQTNESVGIFKGNVKCTDPQPQALCYYVTVPGIVLNSVTPSSSP